MENKNISIPVAIVIAGIIIAGAVFYTKKPASTDNNEQNNPGQNQSAQLKEVNENDHVLGNPNAEITIIEFSDIECPFCKKFHETMNQIIDEYGKDGKVKWVYRHFPLDALHSKARKEAEATECANELGGNEKFWEYINRLYSITPSNNGLDLNKLYEIADYVKIDSSKFKECLDSGKYAGAVEEDYQDGISAGVEGTPFSIIIDKKGNKYPVSGYVPFEQFKLAIEQLLSSN